MYLQLMAQIEERIALGEWPIGMKLPSIRMLAIELNISVITVKRAYLELERNNVILTQQGKGSWVNDRVNVDSMQKKELDQHIAQAVRLAKQIQLSDGELLDLLKSALEKISSES